MSGKPSQDNDTAPAETQSESPTPDKGGATRLRLKVVLAVVLAAVGLAATAYTGIGLSVLKKLPVLSWVSSTKQTAPTGTTTTRTVFERDKPEELVSNRTLLESVGSSPVDPSRVLFAAFEKSVLPDNKGSAKSCPPLVSAAEKQTASTKSKDEADEPTQERADLSHDRAKSDRSPRVVSRRPSEEPQEKDSAKPDSDTGAVPTTESENPEEKQAAENESPSDSSKPSTSGRSRASIPEKRPTSSAALRGSDVLQDAKEKTENYQLPGSLVVDVKNYKGTPVQWGLMVILDDSQSMGKKVKPWNPDRMTTALDFVKALPRILTPGSKLAVRDFYCSQGRSRSGRRGLRCLSRLLIEWSAPSSGHLSDKITKDDPKGSNNPCAAVAYTMKKDFPLGDGLSPRILVVTGGITRCAYQKVLHAKRSARGARKARVDVVAVGMTKRSRSGYAKLSKNTQGVFLALEKPADLKAALARYAKAFKVHKKEVMTVKGEEAEFKVGSGDEITLAPGSYTITLPPVKGLDPAKRRLSKPIEIKSGQNRKLVVAIRKGRPVVTVVR